jgi:hypothetical protein
MCSFVDWLIRGGQLVGWTDKIFDQPILLRFGKKKRTKTKFDKLHSRGDCRSRQVHPSNGLPTQRYIIRKEETSTLAM